MRYTHIGPCGSNLAHANAEYLHIERPPSSLVSWTVKFTGAVRDRAADLAPLVERELHSSLEYQSETMNAAGRNAPRVGACRCLSHRAAAGVRAASQQEAATAASMEDMLRATVLEHRDAVGAQHVVVVMSRGLGPFPSADALVAWCGGLPLLYEELQLRFPHAAAIGVSARLAAIRPFPFASGSAMTTVCVVTAVASALSALVVESVVLGVRNASNVLVRTLPDKGSPCLILCLEGVTAEQFPITVRDVVLSSLPPMRSIANSCLRSACLSDLPLLESIGEYAFAQCLNLSSVDLCDLPSLRSIGSHAFFLCVSLQSISFANFALLESIGEKALCECKCLSYVNLARRGPLLEEEYERTRSRLFGSQCTQNQPEHVLHT